MWGKIGDVRFPHVDFQAEIVELPGDRHLHIMLGAGHAGYPNQLLQSLDKFALKAIDGATQ